MVDVEPRAAREMSCTASPRTRHHDDALVGDFGRGRPPARNSDFVSAAFISSTLWVSPHGADCIIASIFMLTLPSLID